MFGVKVARPREVTQGVQFAGGRLAYEMSVIIPACFQMLRRTVSEMASVM